MITDTALVPYDDGFSPEHRHPTVRALEFLADSDGDAEAAVNTIRGWIGTRPYVPHPDDPEGFGAWVAAYRGHLADILNVFSAGA